MLKLLLVSKNLSQFCQNTRSFCKLKVEKLSSDRSVVTSREEKGEMGKIKRRGGNKTRLR